MPRDFKRADRVSDAIQRSIADIIRSEIRDPRVGMPNINSVRIPNDLSTAKVYVTFIGLDDEESIDEAVTVLNDAAGYIRTRVARDVTMRVVPKIQFFYDHVVVEGQMLSSLIDDAIKSDVDNKSGGQ